MAVLAIVLGVLFCISALLLFACCVHCCYGNTSGPELGQSNRTGQKIEKKGPLGAPSEVVQTTRRKISRLPNIAYKDLEKATKGFSDAEVLGEGGFGKVYKGKLNDKEVAVKKLKGGSGQGDDEFQTEIEFLSRAHHCHVVTLIGFCIFRDKRLLVYEFVHNNSLRVHLHGDSKPTMEWSRRLGIAIGSAKGLEYLHEHCEPRIIHRDIKSDNILLDHDFKPKVADFGLAKFFHDAIIHISTNPKGTPGYVDPDYFKTRTLNEKSDIYSFGVVLLELISGRRPVKDNINIVIWAIPRIKQALRGGKYEDLVDPKLQKPYNSREMAQMIVCAGACVNESTSHRPTMSQVVRILEGTIPTGIFVEEMEVTTQEVEHLAKQA